MDCDYLTIVIIDAVKQRADVQITRDQKLKKQQKKKYNNMEMNNKISVKCSIIFRVHQSMMENSGQKYLTIQF